MKKILVSENKVYTLDSSGKTGLLEEDLPRGFFNESVACLFTGGQFKHVKDTVEESQISKSFSDGFQIQEEIFPAGERQILGVKQDFLEYVYAIIPFSKTALCIPYPLAVRAYLLSERKALEGVFIVVEVLQDLVLMTQFEGMFIREERVFPFTNPQDLVEEIGRSRKKVRSFREAQSVRILINDSLTASLYAETSTEDFVEDIRDQSPGTLGVERARFGVSFCPSMELSRRSSTKEARNNALWLGCVVFIGMVCISMLYLLNKQKLNVYVERDERERLLQQETQTLRSLTADRYLGLVRSKGGHSKAKLFRELLAGLPKGWRLEQFVWSQSEDTERVEARITGGHLYKGLYKGDWQRAETTDISIGGRPARTLVLLWEGV